jgi:hypothetical protein
MSTKREKQYQCAYSSGSGEFSCRVTAWTPQAAGEIFREALVRAGVKQPGMVRVTDLRGAVTFQSHGEPPALSA